MTIEELEELIDYSRKTSGLSEEDFRKMLVMIPVIDADEGEFITPSSVESGVDELEIEDSALESEPAFLLIPNGFTADEFNPQLN